MYFHTNIFLLTSKWDVMWVNYKSVLFWFGFGVLSLQFWFFLWNAVWGHRSQEHTPLLQIFNHKFKHKAYRSIRAEKSHNFNCSKWKIKKLFRKPPWKLHRKTEFWVWHQHLYCSQQKAYYSNQIKNERLFYFSQGT